jgi:hypothetical protein
MEISTRARLIANQGYYAKGIGLTGPIEGITLPGGRIIELTKPFSVQLRNKEIITVPIGFATDYASVPRLFWRLFPPWDDYSPAAVIHDYIYVVGDRPRRKADAIFLELMDGLPDISWLRARIMWLAVRLGGWVGWRQRRRAQSQGKMEA